MYVADEFELHLLCFPPCQMTIKCGNRFQSYSSFHSYRMAASLSLPILLQYGRDCFVRGSLVVKTRELSLRRMIHHFKIPIHFALPNRKQDHFTTSTSFPFVNNSPYCCLLGCNISKCDRWSTCSRLLQIADDVSAMTWAEEQKRAYECKRQHSDCGTAFMLQKARKWCSLYVN